MLCWFHCSRAARWNKRVENEGDFVGNMLTLSGKWYEIFDGGKKKLYRPAIPILIFMFHQHIEHKVSNANHSRNETCFTYTK